MNFLIIGCGSIGKRHIRNLISIGINKDNLNCVETRDDRIKEVNDYGIKNTFKNLDDAIDKKKYDAAIVCSPTSMHIDQCIKLSEKKIHLLIEKPLSRDLHNIDKLIENVKKNNLVVLMAYVFRFSPQVQKMKELIDKKIIGKIYYARGEFSEYLPDWHPYEDYRSFYMAEKSLGGGSILDQSLYF